MERLWACRVGSIILGVLGSIACGNAGQDSHPSESTSAAREGIIEVQGRAFMRRDLWSKQDFDRIVYEGRADQPSTTPEVLAAQLRAHMAVGNEYYIELEPNLELAKTILRNEPVPSTPSSEPREARTVIGSDSRSALSSPGTYPWTTIAFNESRGSGARISQNALYTTAHVVYQTQFGVNNWFCHDGSTTSGCNRPRWRFGMNGSTAFAGWTAYNCDSINIPTAFVSLTDTTDETAWGHWDFAVVNLTNCANKGNTGWLGTWPATDAELLNADAYQVGYPARALCPAGTNGDTGFNSGGAVLGTDCPGTGSWPGNTYRLINTTAPYAGGTGYLAFSADVWAGSAFTVRSTVDLTHGDSGGPLYTILNGSDRRVLGAASLSPKTYNVFNRWTSEVHNWFTTYSPFPN